MLPRYNRIQVRKFNTQTPSNCTLFSLLLSKNILFVIRHCFLYFIGITSSVSSSNSLQFLRIVLIKLLMPSYNDTTVNIEAADDCNDLLTAFILSKIVSQIHVNEKNTNSSSNRFYSNNWPFSFVYG